MTHDNKIAKPQIGFFHTRTFQQTIHSYLCCARESSNKHYQSNATTTTHISSVGLEPAVSLLKLGTESNDEIDPDTNIGSVHE